MKVRHFRTWIEISKKTLEHNYSTLRASLPKSVQMLGVIKSNAYGHELFRFGQELQRLGIDWLGVDSITEALALRATGLTRPILVMGYTLPANFALASAKNIALTISTFESLSELTKIKKRVPIHLKIDTGMHRQGFSVKDLPAVISKLRALPHVVPNGFYTHFAAAKKPDASHATELQIKEFQKAVKLIKPVYPNALAHASATAGILNYPEANFNMVRPGIGLYGLWPSDETRNALRSKITLRPVLTWKTIISELKLVEKREKIGYDYTETLRRKTKVAVLPVGYWHGYWRAFSSKAYVLVSGKRCRVLGRVSMDMITVDVTDAKSPKVGDEVVLIGKQGKQEVTADELAKIAGTSCYEIVTRLNPLIKKNYV